MAQAGGWKDAEANELNDAALAVKAAVEQQAANDKKPQFECFEVVEGTKQVVAGMNYKIKIKIGNEKFIEVKVYRSLPPVSYELKSITY